MIICQNLFTYIVNVFFNYIFILCTLYRKSDTVRKNESYFIDLAMKLAHKDDHPRLQPTLGIYVHVSGTLLPRSFLYRYDFASVLKIPGSAMVQIQPCFNCWSSYHWNK